MLLPLLLTPLAFAQEAPELAALRAQRDVADALLAAAGVLASPASLTDDKVAAVAAIARLGDRRGLPFLELAAQQQPPIRAAVAENAAAFSTEPAMHVLVIRLAQPDQPLAVQQAAVAALDAAAVPTAFDELWQIATAPETSDEIRQQARAQLSASHAEALAAAGGLPPLQITSDPSAVTGMMVSSAIVGSTVFASLGQVGQTDAGPLIGGIGGALIGGSLGVVASQTNDISVEDAAQYTTGTILGGTAGLMLAAGIEAEPDATLYLTTLGTVAGAGGALLSFQNEPSTADTGELNIAVLLGQQIGSGAHRWASPDSSSTPLLGLAGGAAGGAAALLVRQHIELDEDDAALMAAGGTGGLWLSLLLPPAADWELDAGATQVAISTGALAGAAVGQLRDVPARQTGITSVSFVSGNLIGLSLPMLLSPDTYTGQQLAQSTLAGGVLGAGAGAFAAPRMSFDAGDAALLPIGTALTIADASAISYILTEKTGFDAPGGLILLSAGAGSAGWGLATQALDVDPGAPLLVASGAGWGTFYGAMVPIALDLDGDASDLVLSITVASNALMAGAVVAQLPSVGLAPESTVVPQLGGLGGAVVGTLGTALFTDDGQTVSAGALGGSLVGFGVGVALEQRFAPRRVSQLQRQPLSRRLPGQWAVSAHPTVIDEAPGVYLGVQARGL